MKWYISFTGLTKSSETMFGGHVIEVDNDETFLTVELINKFCEDEKMNMCLSECVILNAFRIK
jgi:hypothetical protein